MQSSWENELISLQKTDGSSFEIFAKDIQKTAGRLSFERDENTKSILKLRKYIAVIITPRMLYMFLFQQPTVNGKYL